MFTRRGFDPGYWLDSLLQDVRFALRLISRTPWVSLTIAATLTLGIGLNVSVFSLLNGLLLRPWVKTDPATFVSIIPRFSGKYELRFSDYGAISQPEYVFLRDTARSIESLAAYRLLNTTLSGLESGSVRTALVTCNLFEVIKPGAPIVGRYLAADECASAADPRTVMVLGERAWRTRFGANPDVVGRIVHLNRVPFTVVGVAPAFGLSAGAPNSQVDVWIPYTMLHTLRPADDYFSDRHARWLTIVGRRHRAFAVEQVQQEFALLAREADREVPGRVTTLLVTDGSLVKDPEMRARAPLVFAVTLGTTLLLLLLACVNVTTLLLSRSAAREREIAVRVSLGAGRGRLLRQFLTEALLLSGTAGIASFLIAQRAPAAIWYSVTSQAAPFNLAPDSRVVFYCLGVAVMAGLVAGLSPAAEALRRNVAESLKGSTGAVTAGQRRRRFRSALVSVQIALSVLLVAQVGLFLRAQRGLFDYDPGFETGRVLNVALSSVAAGFDPSTSFYDELESRVAALPGVLHTSYASLAPWNGRNSTRVDAIDGQPIADTRDFRRDPARRVVSASYFDALGIPLSRGRAFTRDEQLSMQVPVPAVISEAMAHRYWPGQDPVGRQFRVNVMLQVVGVCRDVQSVALMQDDGPFYYVPLDTRRANPAYLLVRVANDPGAAAAAIRTIVRQLDPQMAVAIASLESMVEQVGERRKPFMLYGAASATLALLLALTGVYAVVSFSVSQRVREIGIRMALGAQRHDVALLVLRSAALSIGGGLVAGVGLAVLASVGTKAILVGINPRDPLTLIGVPLLLFTAAVGATWIPARRAARLDPTSSLRSD